MEHTEVARLAPSRLPIPAAIAKEFEIEPAEWRVLVEQIFPSAKSVEAVTMALSYCRARKLDIYKKPVHIVPMWNSQLGRMVETVWPGIAEIRTTAARTLEYAGIDEVAFGPDKTRTFEGEIKDGGAWKKQKREVTFPEWASVVVHRIVKGVRCPYHAKIFWEETYATTGRGELPNEMWSKRPRGQFIKCLEADALRKAFPEEIGSMYAAEEMEGRTIELAALPATPTPPPAPRAPEPPDGQETAYEAETFLAELETTLEALETADEIDAAFDEADPQSQLADDDDALARAFQIKADQLKRVGGEEKPFPGDVAEQSDG